MMRSGMADRIVALFVAVLFAAAPGAFVMCELSCTHGARAAGGSTEHDSPAHACHDSSSTPVSSEAGVHGVPPQCTHADGGQGSPSRVEPTLSRSANPLLSRELPIGSEPVAFGADTQGRIGPISPPGLTPTALPLRV
jgi:hypothetical protein